MDPNAVLESIHKTLSYPTDAALESIDESVNALRTWLASGGFAPRWERFPLGTSYYKTRCAQIARDFEREFRDAEQGFAEGTRA